MMRRLCACASSSSSGRLDERALGRLGDRGCHDADPVRYRSGCSVHENGEAGVDVVGHLLGYLAPDAVHRLAAGRAGDGRERYTGLLVFPGHRITLPALSDA